MKDNELEFCKSYLDAVIEREGFECVDNFRFAEVGNTEEEDEYQNMLDNGCCGFYDTVASFNGKDFKIGCNYGH